MKSLRIVSSNESRPTRLPLRILFEHPSVTALAGALEALSWSGGGGQSQPETEDSRDREVVEL